MDMRATVILLLTSWTLLVWPAASQTTCDLGWFGSSCQYKCRCGSNNCSANGLCTNGGSCEGGWFGPACQYADLAYRGSTSAGWKPTDGDDRTCLPPPHADSITIMLNNTYRFTWLRVRLNNTDLLYNVTVHFRRDNSLNCTNRRTGRVDNYTLDIHCDLEEKVQNLTLSGAGVRHLCSIYISGGRNVALRQNTLQSSTYVTDNVHYSSNKSVDGNTDTDFDHKSCTHTKWTQTNPNLNVTFSSLHHVTRYVLYNRKNNRNRLKGFVLTSYNQSLTPVFNYPDRTNQTQPVYTVIADNVSAATHLVNVVATNGEEILTLCELEVYGDTACQPGQYGRECEYSCNCAGEQPCFVSTGGCPSGCAVGFQGQDCLTGCDPGSYGPGCQSSCSQFCVRNNKTMSDFCDKINGVCPYGCQPGYQGYTCTEVQPPDDDNVVVVVAVVVAVVCVVVIVSLIVAILVCRRRSGSAQAGALMMGDHNDTKNKKDVRPSTSHTGLMTKQSFQSQKSKKAREGSTTCSNGVYYNTAGDSSSSVISLDQLSQFMKMSDRAFFENQFLAIPGNQTASMSVGLSPANKDKNRYKNVCAYDHSRVHLIPNEDKNQGDYINASYVEGYRNDERFIASQGPTETILEDFLRMLWEQEVEKVVMLTNLVEDGKKKCERYWPEERDMRVGDMTVKLATTQVFADYTIRRLQLRKEVEPLRSVIQFHFTAWPDKDIPTVPWGLVDFEQRVASYPTNKPIVVHCSAGVGRTGTFIALRNVMREAEETGHMDFFNTVRRLRQDRVNMVQTVDQYIFLHRAALVAMACMGTSVTLGDVEQRIHSLEAKSKSGSTRLQAEFQAINSVCEDQNEDSTSEDNSFSLYANSQNLANNQKDRVPSVVANEMYRAVLSCDANNSSDYINAVLVPSFVKQHQEILTQLPLPSTITDLWRLVTQYKVTLMVAFETDRKVTNQTVCDHLPTSEEESRSVGKFTLRLEPETTKTSWKQDQVYISQATDTNKKIDKPWSLTHLTCTTNLDPANLLTLTQHVRSLKSAAEGRTLYMCRNGAEYSGLICVLSLLLDRIDNDHQLTVPLVVGSIKAIRPQVIPTLDQYRLLYKVLQLYSRSVNEYSNFT